jgi:hypothetical protein
VLRCSDGYGSYFGITVGNARVYKTSKNGELKNGERFSNRPMVHFLKESNVTDSAKANSVFCCSVYGTY